MGVVEKTELKASLLLERFKVYFKVSNISSYIVIRISQIVNMYVP